jgi:type II secretory pathway pseudopilin PulG
MLHYRRAGFALRELVVLIAIFAVMGLLLLPAVLRMREPQNRLTCQNNLHKIALACHNYESQYGRLPPGGIESPYGDTGDGQTYLGCLPFLLPFLERDDLFWKFDVSDGNGIKFDANAELPAGTKPWYLNETNLNLACARIPAFLCPSDNADASANAFVYVYAGNGTMNASPMPTSQANLGRTNYMPSAGSIGRTDDKFYDKYCGVFTDRSKNKTGNIYNGLSNTFLIGEYLGDYSSGPRTYAASWMGAGSCGTAWGLPVPGYQWNGPANYGWLSFNSKHLAVVQFAMCDGSVQRIRKGVGAHWFSQDWYTFQRAGGFQDGEVLDLAR